MKKYFTRLNFFSFAILRLLYKIKTNKISRTQKYGIRIKVWSRNSRIPSALVNYRVFIHNGKRFYPIKIKNEMVSHKFGEFAFTKRMSTAIHWSRRKKNTSAPKRR